VSGLYKTRPSQKRGEPRCEIDTWGTHFAALSNPIVGQFARYPRESANDALPAYAVGVGNPGSLGRSGGTSGCGVGLLAARGAVALRAAGVGVADRKAAAADRWESGLVPSGTSLLRYERPTMNIRRWPDRESMKACNSLLILLHATKLPNNIQRHVTELSWGLRPPFRETRGRVGPPERIKTSNRRTLGPSALQFVMGAQLAGEMDSGSLSAQSGSGNLRHSLGFPDARDGQHCMRAWSDSTLPKELVVICDSRFFSRPSLY
jgi:hypothetical protein